MTEKRTSSSTSLIKGSAARIPPSRQVGSDSWSNFSYRGRVGRIPLLIDELHPDESADRLRDIFAEHGELYDNGAGVPVRIRSGRNGKFAQLATKTIIVREAHKICQPLVLTPTGFVPTRLKADLAQHYLEHENLGLPPLNGIVTTPLLQDDGTISKLDGYDPASGMYCYDVPDITGMVPGQPTQAEAEAALRLLREGFRTFCFADAPRVQIPELADMPVVDIDKPPGVDESAFLTSLLTCTCRASLPLAPGLLFRAPSISGSGAAKGLSARCVFYVAFGFRPSTVPPGMSEQETEKKIATKLIQSGPAVFLDNFNNYAMKSNALASCLTEVPCDIRTFGKLKDVTVTAASVVLLTGNGVTLSLDHTRRWLPIEFDPQVDFPERRKFSRMGQKFADYILGRRKELIAAVLTIWRFGRTSPVIKEGMPIGSFETWAAWCRDPLFTLGCPDPVPRLCQEKERDPARLAMKDLFLVWRQHHRDEFVRIRDLHADVKAAICALHGVDPQRASRQYIAMRVKELERSQIAGFKLDYCQDPEHLGSSSDWGYRLMRTA